jgi:hypothetical protein
MTQDGLATSAVGVDMGAISPVIAVLGLLRTESSYLTLRREAS